MCEAQSNKMCLNSLCPITKWSLSLIYIFPGRKLEIHWSSSNSVFSYQFLKMYEVVKLEEGRVIRQVPSYPNRHFTLFLSLLGASLRPASRPLSFHIWLFSHQWDTSQLGEVRGEFCLKRDFFGLAKTERKITFGPFCFKRVIMVSLWAWELRGTSWHSCSFCGWPKSVSPTPVGFIHWEKWGR